MKIKQLLNNKGLLFNITMNFLVKGLSVFIGFILIPLYYRYFANDTLYGIWLTLVTILSWMEILDIGLSNSLRNKLTYYHAKNDGQLINQYMSTGYIINTLFGFGVFVFGFIFIKVFDITKILNITTVDKVTIDNSFILLLLLLSIRFSLQIVNNVFYAFQQVYLPAFIMLTSHLMMIIYLLVSIHYQLDFNLNYVVISYGLAAVLPLIISSILVFAKNANLRPSFRMFNSSLIKELVGTGLLFFVIQLSSLVIFTTDNVIISKVLGSEHVIEYQIAYKYFSAGFIAFNLILGPIWSRTTKAIADSDYSWIKKTLKKLISIYVLISCGIVLCVIFYEPFLHLWMGKDFKIKNVNLKYFMALYYMIYMWTNMFAYILNGANRLKLQFYTVGFGAIINIPLSIFLSKTMGMGVSGVILGSSLSLVLFAVLAPWDLSSYLKVREKVKLKIQLIRQ